MEQLDLTGSLHKEAIDIRKGNLHILAPIGRAWSIEELQGRSRFLSEAKDGLQQATCMAYEPRISNTLFQRDTDVGALAACT